MIAMLHFATLVVTTIFAAATAVGLHWLALKAMFILMRPATARRVASPVRLASGTVQLARAYAAHR
jgi:TRAP-type mannitol/chloroaromatic compound transport system permease large subunit